MSDSLERLYKAVVAAKTADPAISRTARLLRSGRPKMAKKLAEKLPKEPFEATPAPRRKVVALEVRRSQKRRS